MDIPLRYLEFFFMQIERSGYRTGARRPERWICRRCAKAITPNNAAAQSHVAWHLRRVKEKIDA